VRPRQDRQTRHDERHRDEKSAGSAEHDVKNSFASKTREHAVST